jgi:predicted RNase H-like nuclease
VVGVLGIDAAWTEKEPSGVALIENSQEGWRCVAVTPSYDSFLALAEGTPVDWNTKTWGTLPDVGRLVAAAETLFGRRQLTVVTVDMPLSTEPITGRRAADAAISRAYGGRGAAVHSPSSERLGAISDQLTREFAASGFPWRPAPRPRVPPTVWWRSTPIRP